MRVLINSLVLMALLFVATSAGAQNVTGNLHCTCVLGLTTCNFNYFNEAAGNPTHDWYQDFFYKAGTTPAEKDLTLACWRKRDAVGLGDSLCCSLKNDETDAPRYFRGELN